jgi:hypothetical protein
MGGDPFRLEILPIQSDTYKLNNFQLGFLIYFLFFMFFKFKFMNLHVKTLDTILEME